MALAAAQSLMYPDQHTHERGGLGSSFASDGGINVEHRDCFVFDCSCSHHQDRGYPNRLLDKVIWHGYVSGHRVFYFDELLNRSWHCLALKNL